MASIQNYLSQLRSSHVMRSASQRSVATTSWPQQHLSPAVLPNRVQTHEGLCWTSPSCVETRAASLTKPCNDARLNGSCTNQCLMIRWAQTMHAHTPHTLDTSTSLVSSRNPHLRTQHNFVLTKRNRRFRLRSTSVESTPPLSRKIPAPSDTVIDSLHQHVWLLPRVPEKDTQERITNKVNRPTTPPRVVQQPQ